MKHPNIDGQKQIEQSMMKDRLLYSFDGIGRKLPSNFHGFSLRIFDKTGCTSIIPPFYTAETLTKWLLNQHFPQVSSAVPHGIPACVGIVGQGHVIQHDLNEMRGTWANLKEAPAASCGYGSFFGPPLGVFPWKKCGRGAPNLVTVLNSEKRLELCIMGRHRKMREKWP